MKIRLVILCLALLVANSHADILFSQDGSAITMNIVNQSYTLTTDYTGNWAGVAVFDVFSSDGFAYAASVVSGSFEYSINGAETVVANNWTGWQYRPGTEGAYDSNDAAYLIGLSAGTWQQGDTITVNATLVMDSTSDSDIILPDLFSSESLTGLTGQGGALISETAAVPEPASALLLFVGVGVMGLIRRFYL